LLRWLLARVPPALKYRLQAAPESRPSGFLDEAGKPVEQLLIDRLIKIAAKSWRPRQFDGQGVLFRATFDGDRLPGRDFSNGWRDLFMRGLEIVQSAGDHVSMADDENAPILARQINEVLDRHETLRNTTRAVKPDKETTTGVAAQQWPAAVSVSP
jgi:thioesterase domain-containing protein